MPYYLTSSQLDSVERDATATASTSGPVQRTRASTKQRSATPAGARRTADPAARLRSKAALAVDLMDEDANNDTIDDATQQQPEQAPSKGPAGKAARSAKGTKAAASTAAAVAATATTDSQQTTPEGGVGGDQDLLPEIKACETWQDVLEIVADEAARLSLFSASQAATRIAAIIRPQPAPDRTVATADLAAHPAFDTLVKILGDGVPRMRRAQLCNSLAALVQLNYKLAPTMLASYSLRARQLAPEMNDRDVSMLLHAFAQAGIRPAGAVLDDIGYQAMRLMEAGECDPQVCACDEGKSRACGCLRTLAWA